MRFPNDEGGCFLPLLFLGAGFGLLGWGIGKLIGWVEDGQRIEMAPVAIVIGILILLLTRYMMRD